MNIKVLPYKGKAFEEVRPAYFLKAFGEDVLDMRIFSFGKCNYSCPYCKRDGADKTDNEIIEGAIDVSEEAIYKAIDEAIARHQVVRFSGGDPVCYSALVRELMKYAKSKGGITSIAHNGSGPKFVESILPYLDFASIDFKAVSYKQLGEIAGINEEMARTCFTNTINTIKILQNNRIYTDVRTCVFNDTTYEQLAMIANFIQNSENVNNLFWTLRTYSPIDDFDKSPKTPQEMTELAQEISKSNPELKIGVRAKWEPSGFAYFLGGEQKEQLESSGSKILNFSNIRRGGPVFE